MNIDPQLMTQIARLAKLRLDDAERDALRTDLQAMLAYVASLQSLDLGELRADAEPPLSCPERPDAVQCGDAEGALEGFPRRQDRLLQVPRIVDDA